MPTIVNHKGAKIIIYVNDHQPPHIHIKYGKLNAKMNISNGKIIKGFLPITIASSISKYCIENKMFLLGRWDEIHSGRNK